MGKKIYQGAFFPFIVDPFPEGSKQTGSRKRYVPCKTNHLETCLYNFDPLKLYLYIVKLGLTGVYIIFLIFAQQHRLWVLVRTASPRRF